MVVAHCSRSTELSRAIAPSGLRGGLATQCLLWVKIASCASQKGMSALHPKADMCSANGDVRFVPIADIRQSFDQMKTLILKKTASHLVRFILIAIYTGSRAGAVLTASPYRGEGRSYVDLKHGIFYRLAEGSRETNKRQPPVPLPPRLLAHLRRWFSNGLVHEYFVEWNGKPVQSVKTAFKTALRLAGIQGRVTPHTLRHTAATWLMQNEVDKWEAAGFLGMSVEMLDRVYGHHHPDHLRRAAPVARLPPSPIIGNTVGSSTTATAASETRH